MSSSSLGRLCFSWTNLNVSTEKADESVSGGLPVSLAVCRMVIFLVIKAVDSDVTHELVWESRGQVVFWPLSHRPRTQK